MSVSQTRVPLTNVENTSDVAIISSLQTQIRRAIDDPSACILWSWNGVGHHQNRECKLDKLALDPSVVVLVAKFGKGSMPNVPLVLSS